MDRVSAAKPNDSDGRFRHLYLDPVSGRGKPASAFKRYSPSASLERSIDDFPGDTGNYEISATKQHKIAAPFEDGG